MSLKVPVYISEVNNLSDARYCAGMGVEWLGFAINDDNILLFEGIQNWVEGVKFVAEFKSNKVVSDTPEYFNGILSGDGNHIPVNSKFDEYFQSIVIQNSNELKSFIEKQKSDQMIYILEEGTQSVPLDLEVRSMLKDVCTKAKVILGFGIEPEHLDWILKELKPHGIMLKGGEEIRPGLKDFDDLAEILEALEEND
jgi:phosphoribosylanthranilate isomerase